MSYKIIVVCSSRGGSGSRCPMTTDVISFDSSADADRAAEQLESFKESARNEANVELAYTKLY